MRFTVCVSAAIGRCKSRGHFGRLPAPVASDTCLEDGHWLCSVKAWRHVSSDRVAVTIRLIRPYGHNWRPPACAVLTRITALARQGMSYQVFSRFRPEPAVIAAAVETTDNFVVGCRIARLRSMRAESVSDELVRFGGLLRSHRMAVFLAVCHQWACYDIRHLTTASRGRSQVCGNVHLLIGRVTLAEFREDKVHVVFASATRLIDTATDRRTASKCGGNARLRFSARRRIPLAAVAEREYFGATLGSKTLWSEQTEKALSLLCEAKPLSIKTCDPSTITDSLKLTQDGFKVAILFHFPFTTFHRARRRLDGRIRRE